MSGCAHVILTSSKLPSHKLSACLFCINGFLRLISPARLIQKSTFILKVYQTVWMLTGPISHAHWFAESFFPTLIDFDANSGLHGHLHSQSKVQTRHKIINVWLQGLFCCCVASEGARYLRCNYNQRMGENRGGVRENNKRLSCEGPSVERETEDGFCANRNRLSRTVDRERNMTLPTYSNRAISMPPLHFLKP